MRVLVLAPRPPLGSPWPPPGALSRADLARGSRALVRRLGAAPTGRSGSAGPRPRVQLGSVVLPRPGQPFDPAPWMARIAAQAPDRIALFAAPWLPVELLVALTQSGRPLVRAGGEPAEPARAQECPPHSPWSIGAPTRALARLAIRDLPCLPEGSGADLVGLDGVPAAEPAGPLDDDLVAAARRLEADLLRQATILWGLEDEERELRGRPPLLLRAIGKHRRRILRILRKRGWYLGT